MKKKNTQFTREVKVLDIVYNIIKHFNLLLSLSFIFRKLETIFIMLYNAIRRKDMYYLKSQLLIVQMIISSLITIMRTKHNFK